MKQFYTDSNHSSVPAQQHGPLYANSTLLWLVMLSVDWRSLLTFCQKTIQDPLHLREGSSIVRIHFPTPVCYHSVPTYVHCRARVHVYVNTFAWH